MGHQTTSMFEMDTFVHVYVYYTAVTQSWHNFGMAALTASPQLEILNFTFKLLIQKHDFIISKWKYSSHQAVTHGYFLSIKIFSGYIDEFH